MTNESKAPDGGNTPQTTPESKPLLGEVSFSSSQTTYKVMVESNGLNMRWYDTVVKNEQVNYVSEIWCADNYRDEYVNLKKSVKKKIRKMVQDAVSSSLLNSTLLEANKAIDECVMKTGLTREQVLLYVSGKVDRYKLLISWCNDC
jgi:hypothetical protein